MERTDATIESSADSGPARRSDDPAPGLVVAGSYRLLELLGAGGMADVYEAEHLRLGNRVAVKFLRSSGRSDQRGTERFRHEARRVAALSSEHVVKVFDCGELPGGAPYLVMERLWGEDLRSLLARETKLPVRRAVELAIGACRGLSVVHAAGLVHRDLKPANLFVVRSSSNADQCKILDFGVAKTLVSDATASGALLGTVRYMAPEQLEDASSARAIADIYAIGAILYECLSGVPPHRGETLQELMFDIVHRDPAPLRQHCDVPAELERIVMKALAREQSKRFARADRLALALAPFGGLGQSSRLVESPDEATLAEELRPASRRRMYLLGIACFAGGFAAAMSAGSSFHRTVDSRRTETTRVAPAAPTSAPTARPSAPSTASSVTPPPTQSARGVSPPLLRKPQTSPHPPPNAPTPERDRFDSQDPYAE